MFDSLLLILVIDGSIDLRLLKLNNVLLCIKYYPSIGKGSLKPSKINMNPNKLNMCVLLSYATIQK